MTELLSDLEAPSDAELISSVRGGDVAAYGELFSRHIDAANRLGRQLVRGPDVDDLVSEAFAKVLKVLRGGGGPDVAFRAYLLTSVRRLHIDKVRAASKLTTSADMTQFDPGVPFQDTAVADFESGAAAKAFASLPERWQLVLWHLEVEGQKPAEIAPLLGMSANSVSALAYRAREGLRQAFLTMHLSDTSAAQCRWVNEHLGAYVRKGLSKRDTAKVEDHLDECRRCTAMYLELTEVNSNLAGIIAPLLLGAAAAGYLASSGTVAAGGILVWLSGAKAWVAANSGVATAGAVAAGVTVVATAGFMIANGGSPGNDVATGNGIESTNPAPSGTPTPPPATTAGEPNKTPAKKPAVAPVTTLPVVPTELLPSKNIHLDGVIVAGGQLVVSVSGLPKDRITLAIDLGSASGDTTFATVQGRCSVRASDPTHAACVPGTMSRMAAMKLAPSRYEAVIPLKYPINMQSDQLTVRVSVVGYDDPDRSDNRLRQTFTPVSSEQPTPTPDRTTKPTPTADPTPTPDETPTPTPTPVAFQFVGNPVAVSLVSNSHRVTAAVKGVPAGATGLVFRLPDSQQRFERAGPGCAIVDPHEMDCATAGPTFTAVFEAQLPGKDPGALIVNVSGTDVSARRPILVPSI